MLPSATIETLRQVIRGYDLVLVYSIAPLPAGLVSAARGGLALLFNRTTSPTTRLEQLQRLRFQVLGKLPAGHTEMISLNDCRLDVAAAVIENGVLVSSADEGERLRFETMVLSRSLDFEYAMRRYFLRAPAQQGGDHHDQSG